MCDPLVCGISVVVVCGSGRAQAGLTREEKNVHGGASKCASRFLALKERFHVRICCLP